MKTGSANNCISQNREENINKGLGMKQEKENLVWFSCKKGDEKYGNSIAEMEEVAGDCKCLLGVIWTLKLRNLKSTFKSSEWQIFLWLNELFQAFCNGLNDDFISSLEPQELTLT